MLRHLTSELIVHISGVDIYIYTLYFLFDRDYKYINIV